MTLSLDDFEVQYTELQDNLQVVLQQLYDVDILNDMIQLTINSIKQSHDNDRVAMELLDLYDSQNEITYSVIPEIIQIRDKYAQVIKFIDQYSQNNGAFQQESQSNLSESSNDGVDEEAMSHNISCFNSQTFNCYYFPSSLKKRPAIKRVQITELPEYFRPAFSEISEFNDVQSKVFKDAFYNNQNLLISAPTSSGKTNIALLTILNNVNKFMNESNAIQRILQGVDDFNVENSSSVSQDQGVVEKTVIQTNKKTKFSFSDVKQSVEVSQAPDKNELIKRELTKFDGLCVYLTPMKALASEITQKFKAQLISLGLNVLECTGDEAPPQRLVQRANVLILTPEKYDVLTRKATSETPIYIRQQLLIIDEVHLLGVQGRGHVIETIVARTLSAIERHQTPLRIVGISATIPNYVDLKNFLQVPDNGLFVFGDEFRPVKMEKYVIGVQSVRKRNTNKQLILDDVEKNRYAYNKSKGLQECLQHLADVENQIYSDFDDKIIAMLRCTKEEFNKLSKKQQQSLIRKKESEVNQQETKYDDILDLICIELCKGNAENKVPTLVFVHSKRKSQELAQAITTKLQSKQIQLTKRQHSNNKELQNVIEKGVGFHHGGLQKEDRKLVEDLFRDNKLSIVVCTATLAWGVNLPAQTVIIRGTDIRNDDQFFDLDILDVKQIFGRAGRPQYTQEESICQAILLTRHNKVNDYMRKLLYEQKITSHLYNSLPDVINAEIVLGNINTIQNALDFLNFTYYAQLYQKDEQQVITVLNKLRDAKLIQCQSTISREDFNQSILPTPVGQICSYYYITYDTLTKFVEQLSQMAGNQVDYADLLYYISSIPLFQQYRMTSDERDELLQISQFTHEQLQTMQEQMQYHNKLKDDSRYQNQQFKQVLKSQNKRICKYPIYALEDEAEFKINVMIQAFIARYRFKTEILETQMRLIVAQLPRIVQAMFEVLLSFGRFYEAEKMLYIYQSILYQYWFDKSNPFLPIGYLPVGTVEKRNGHFNISYEAKAKSQNIISIDTMRQFENAYSNKKLSSERFQEIDQEELKLDLSRNGRKGDADAMQVIQARKFVPYIHFDVYSAPVSKQVIRIIINGTAGFKYDEKVHGAEVLFIAAIIRKSDGMILNQQTISLNKDNYRSSISMTSLLKVSEWKKTLIGKQTISYSEYVSQLDASEQENNIMNRKMQVYGQNDILQDIEAVIIPITWCGGETIKIKHEIDLSSIILQEFPALQYNEISQDSRIKYYNTQARYFTPIPKLVPLSVRTLHYPEAEQLYRFGYFNTLQSVMFHTLYYNEDNVFIGAPTSSGKTISAELAILQVLKNWPGYKVVYIAPMKALVKERYDDWKQRFGGLLDATVVQLTGDTLPLKKDLVNGRIYISTPEKFDSLTRNLNGGAFLDLVKLIIFDEVQLLGTTRGGVLESIIARVQFRWKNIRVIAMSTSTPNAQDFASWLDIKKQNIFNFDSSARPVPLRIEIQSCGGSGYCNRMEMMNHPTYEAIKRYGRNLPVLVFVSSRRQTRRTAQYILNVSQKDHSAPDQIFKDPMNIQELLSDLGDSQDDYKIEDEDLKRYVSYGIGIHHAALGSSDKDIVIELFKRGKIKILICTATLAWGINVPAHLTVIKGCEYYEKNFNKYVDFDVADILQMAGRAGRPQFISQQYYQWVCENFEKSVADEMEQEGIFENINFHPNQIVPFISDPKKQEYLQEILYKLEDSESSKPKYSSKLTSEDKKQIAALKSLGTANSVVICRPAMKQFYQHFLDTPMPLESSMINPACGNALAAAQMAITGQALAIFPDILNAEICMGGFSDDNAHFCQEKGLTLTQLRNWLHKTFFFKRARQNPTLYGIDQTANLMKLEGITQEELQTYSLEFSLFTNGKNIEKFSKQTLADFFTVLDIYNILDKQIETLLENDLIYIENKISGDFKGDAKFEFNKSLNEDLDKFNKYNTSYKATQAGLLTSRYYLTYKTLKHYHDKYFASDEMTAMEALASSPEFRDIPVRCDENTEMMHLTKEHGFTYFQNNRTEDEFMSVESKTHFVLQYQLKTKLIQNGMYKLDLPTSDYQLDLNSIMDNIARMSSSAIEYGLIYQYNLDKIKDLVVLQQQLLNGFQYNEESKETGKLLKRLCGQYYKHGASLQEILRNYYEKRGYWSKIDESNAFLSSYPNIYWEVSMRLVQKLPGNSMQVDILLKYWHKDEKKRKLQHVFSSESYSKPKLHTYYGYLGIADQNICISYQKLANTPTGAEMTFKDLKLMTNQKIRLILQSDVFVGLDVDVVFEVPECESEYKIIQNISRYKINKQKQEQQAKRQLNLKVEPLEEKQNQNEKQPTKENNQISQQRGKKQNNRPQTKNGNNRRNKQTNDEIHITIE